jgi:hypothetical protein
MPPRHDVDAAVIVGCIALGISSCSCTVHPRADCLCLRSVDLQLKLAGTLNPQYLPPSGCSPPPTSGDCQSGVLLMATPLCAGAELNCGGGGAQRSSCANLRIWDESFVNASQNRSKLYLYGSIVVLARFSMTWQYA